MSIKEDLRVTRTKKALEEAFIDLLSRKTFEEITVNELCEVAGIRRATFYKHYSDKLDFLTAYTYGLRDKFDRFIWKSEMPTLPKEYYIAYARHLIEFISENCNAIENIYKSNLFPSVISIIIDQNYKDTCKRLKKSEEGGLKLNASAEVISSICIGGVATAIVNWQKDGRKISIQELADQIGAVISALIEYKE